MTTSQGASAEPEPRVSYRGFFDASLDDLRSRVFLMSDRVREELSLAYEALINADMEPCRAAFALHRELERMQIEIEEDCFTLISRQQPVAQDLKLIITVLNISVELARMGDQARGLARIAKRLIHSPLPPQLPHGLDTMKRLAQEMHDDTFKAWERRDTEMLAKIVLRDTEVDSLDGEVQTELFTRMASSGQPQEIKLLNELLRASREVERFADLACNIALEIDSYLENTGFPRAAA